MELLKLRSEPLGTELEHIVDLENLLGRAGMKFLEVVLLHLTDGLVKLVLQVHRLVTRLYVELLDLRGLREYLRVFRVEQVGGCSHGEMGICQSL